MGRLTQQQCAVAQQRIAPANIVYIESEAMRRR